MNAAHVWAAITAVALLGFAFKAVGPAVFGGCELPSRAWSVMALMAPALLAAFVMVDLAGPGWSALDLMVVAGVAAGIGLRLCKAPFPVVMVGAAMVTALLRWTG
ncbi:branched-chain amino acid transporter [Streptomyces sp. NBRC 110611]|uniref:AzlD domain-containing protein n=1 Tax=Streptomyces sp. NBRC 110611 TaxID=1621259 RepID=UPI00085759E9|nr:AzlD domain-containing protein [Streptomyces sp. NBRC 110611]GAU71254.1 branched-chain amino acid transporter [Streptomyces sp. NBRC 110611]